MILGVVADDLTGATDAGSMTANAGHLTHVFSHDAFHGPRGAAVCVLDTDSRFDEPGPAYAKVRAATERLAAEGCHRFHKKTCSVFRGNVGAEFDAMLDALDEDFAVVVLGFPRNGRTTVDGVHYVGGVRLEDSPFRDDPVHPATRSRPVDILASQTDRPVAHLARNVVGRGERALADAIADARGRGGYLILDVVDQAALRTIAGAVALTEVRALCGASGLLEELALIWPPPDDAPLGPSPSTGAGVGPVLTVAGSLTPQTEAQVERVRASGVPVIELDTLDLFEEATARGAVENVATAALDPLGRGRDVLLRAVASPERVRATQAAGEERGLGTAGTGRLVSRALAEIAARCSAEAAFAGLVVAGGDTSAAVCRRLGLGSFRVGPEVAPGVPVCTTLAGPRLSVVLKSGSFGAPDLLLRAAERLKEVETCTS